jgi:hypothetical protein
MILPETHVTFNNMNQIHDFVQLAENGHIGNMYNKIFRINYLLPLLLVKYYPFCKLSLGVILWYSSS